MSTVPLISVWMVTYNHQDYIAQAVESVMMQQTDFNVHLFIGEDFSSDNTRNICQSLKQKYPARMSLFLNEKNLGANKNALNIYKACFNSGAKYIAMLEGDDYWTDPLKLQKQVDFLEAHPEYAICFHRANVQREDGSMYLHSVPESKTSYYTYTDLLQQYNFITTASVVFRKPDVFILPAWFFKIPFGDMGLYHLVSKNKKIKCLDDVMSVYRLHSNGIWTRLSELKKEKRFLNFYQIMLPHLTTEEKEIVKNKLKTVRFNIAKLKFPNISLLQQVYYFYLRKKKM